MKKLLLIILIFSGIQFSNVIISQITTTDASSPVMCDGVAMITDSMNVDQNTTSWVGNGIIVQTGGYFVIGLCAGTYTVTFTGALGPVTYTFIIGSGGGNPCAGFSATVTTTSATDNVTCDGNAFVMMWGGTAPYTYTWNNGDITGSISNLCPGIYTCIVTDANGCNSSSTGTVNDNSLSNLDSILIFVNNTYPGVGIIDSLVISTIEDCTIDYGSVGSAGITNYIYLSVDSILITWTLLDTNGLVVAVYDIPTLISNPAAGVFSATLIVFCSQKNININTISVTDQLYLNPAEMGVMENSIAEYTVVNPFNDVIQVVLNDNSTGSIVLLDMNGREVLETNYTNESTINMNSVNVPSGIYILNIEIDGALFTRKLMK